MIFADGEQSNLWGVALAAVAGIGALGTALFTYLAGRDKLRFDADMKDLRKTVAECDRERGELRGNVRELRDRADKASQDCARMEGQIASLERSERENKEEVKDLRDRLKGRQR